MMVRLRSGSGWIPIREVPQPILLKLVKARRVRQGVNFSIFSSSVNERKGSADNHNGHPWGGERESAKKTGLRLPPPCRGLCDQFPDPGWGRGSPGDAVERSEGEPHWKRWRGDRTLSSIGRAEPSGESNLTDSIEKSTDNLTLHKRTSR